MQLEQQERICDACQRKVMASRVVEDRPSHLMHLILSILTIGVWVPFWLVRTFRPAKKSDWQCPICGCFC